MLKLIGLAIVQSFFLMLSQVFLKLAVAQFGAFQFTFAFIKSVFGNIFFIISGITIATAISLWIYILKHYPFSIAYPLGSISYIFGLIAAVLVFHEHVSPMRWLGVCIIIVGIYFITK
jgi:undecaprenyl phosphate-alpha-L-ara4N flippase subunit ArnE